MKIREYANETDYTYISSWVQDEKTHYLWCAERFAYPLKQEDFNNVLDEAARDFKAIAYVVTDDKDSRLGFFVCSINENDKSAFISFVILNSNLRGKGYGTKMMQFISEYFLSDKKVSLLRLKVFDVNISAQKCYERAGFVLERKETNALEFKGEKWGRNTMIKTI